MNKRLEDAIELARALPVDQQELAAEALLEIVHHSAADYRLKPEQAAEVQRRMTDFAAGRLEIASDEEVAAYWRSKGL